MNIKHSNLAAAVTAALAMGVAGQAAAGVYAGSRLEIQNLTLNITGATSGQVDGYTFNLDNTATLNGVSDTTVGISTNCNSVGLPGCSVISPVLSALAANAPGGAPLRVDGAVNNFNFFGPGAGQTYSNSDSEITTSELVQGVGVPTSTRQISETELAGTGTGQSSTNVQSNTQFTFTFDIGAGGGSLVLDFDADPDLYVAVNTLNLIAALAQANTGATFTFSGNDGTLIRWSPDGLTGGFTSCGGVTSCTENNDDESLNNSIGLPTGNPASAGISDNRSTSPDLGWSDFGITILGLRSGSYSGTFAATSSVNAVQRVPEPGMLALMGIGLLGLGMSARRRKLV